MSAPEFSRPVALETLGPEPRTIAIEADEDERAALARRFGLVAIARLEAEASLSRDDSEVTASGRVRAAVTQSCVASGEPVESEVDARFALVFQPPPPPGRPDEEIELGSGELDTLFLEGDSIDLGEAAAQTLALALDPYPRAPSAAAALESADVNGESETGPFAALKVLKDKSGA